MPHPRSDATADLISFGWEMAEAMLAGASGELSLVSHWFATADDDTINVDAHFGSDERTLRFAGVALPTLIDQLEASAAVVVLPWGLDLDAPSLSVLVWSGSDPDDSAQIASRALTRLGAGSGPPFWQLGSGPVGSPSQLASTLSRLGS